ncbi:murein biosynthesis integral membrane protein MurJ, partial [Streptomyces sp. OF3]|nr:murein biosynthesis integral membrane protein MurJ [Streptomyces alkaliterrae]
MNVPYDREPGEGRDPYAGQRGGQDGGQDPYVRDAYRRDPFQGRDPAAQDPVDEALYDHREHPPPPAPPGAAASRYEPPPPPRHAPDPQLWATPPAPEPDGPSRRLPYGDETTAASYTGVDELITRAPDDHDRDGAVPRRPDDAFAHLFQDQGRPAAPPHTPAPR